MKVLSLAICLLGVCNANVIHPQLSKKEGNFNEIDFIRDIYYEDGHSKLSMTIKEEDKECHIYKADIIMTEKVFLVDDHNVDSTGIIDIEEITDVYQEEIIGSDMTFDELSEKLRSKCPTNFKIITIRKFESDSLK